jgi:hypothetical protein
MALAPPETELPTSFAEPVAGGVRRFAPLFGEEVVSVSGTRDGASLIAVTSSRAYVFDRELRPTRAIELPGITPLPTAVAISAERSAVLIRVPGEVPAGRMWLLDHKTRKFVAKVDLGGVPAGGVPLGPSRVAVVLEEPPTLMVLSADDGKVIASHRVLGNPRRLEVSRDGAWAALACAGSSSGGDGGLFVLEMGQDMPTVTQISMGQGKLHPEVALPVGSAILVAGSAEGDRPVGVVVPRQGGDLLATVALGTSRVVGAAMSANGAIAAVFTAGVVGGPAKDSDVDTAADKSDAGKPRTFLLDAGTFRTVAALDGGPFATGRQVVAVNDQLVFPICHAAVYLDLASKTTQLHPFPSPQKGPCLDGIWPVGDRFAARDGHQVLTWPQKFPIE